MNARNQKILLSLIAAIGIFFLVGCGKKISEAEISKVVDADLKKFNDQSDLYKTLGPSVLDAMEANAAVRNGTMTEEEAKKMLEMAPLKRQGFPIDLENNKLVLDAWNVSILLRGSPIVATEMTGASVRASVSGGRADATVDTSGIPSGTKLYPVIYQLTSKDKKYEGIPQERYFYKDTYGQWKAAKAEDVGAEDSAAYEKFTKEFTQKIEAEKKTMKKK